MKLNNSIKFRHVDSDTNQERQEKENLFKRNFGQNLQKYLSDNNIKIDNFASGIGYDRQHVYGICSGKKAPSLFCLWRITEYLNISSEYLLNLNIANLSESTSQNKKVDVQKSALIEKIHSIDDPRIIEFILNNLDFTTDIIKSSSDGNADY